LLILTVSFRKYTNNINKYGEIHCLANKFTSIIFLQEK